MALLMSRTIGPQIAIRPLATEIRSSRLLWLCRVREMPCIGDTLVLRLIARIGAVRRFHSKRTLIEYAGIDAPPYQSGKFRASIRRGCYGKVTELYHGLSATECAEISNTSSEAAK